MLIRLLRYLRWCTQTRQIGSSQTPLEAGGGDGAGRVLLHLLERLLQLFILGRQLNVACQVLLALLAQRALLSLRFVQTTELSQEKREE